MQKYFSLSRHSVCQIFCNISPSSGIAILYRDRIPGSSLGLPHLTNAIWNDRSFLYFRLKGARWENRVLFFVFKRTQAGFLNSTLIVFNKGGKATVFGYLEVVRHHWVTISDFFPPNPGLSWNGPIVAEPHPPLDFPFTQKSWFCNSAAEYISYTQKAQGSISGFHFQGSKSGARGSEIWFAEKNEQIYATSTNQHMVSWCHIPVKPCGFGLSM